MEEVKASPEYCTRGAVSSKYRFKNFFFKHNCQLEERPAKDVTTL